MTDLTATLAVPALNRLGEGPLWDTASATLIWADIVAREIHRFRPGSGQHQVQPLAARPSAFGLTADRRLLVAAGLGLYRLGAAGLEPLALLPGDPALVRTNDGAVGPDGAFWLGTMANNIGAQGEDLPLTPKRGTLYRITLDGMVTAVMTDISITNTFCWAPDGKTFYFTDTADGDIRAYDFDPVTGRLGAKRVLLAKDRLPGHPDGSAIDQEGFLWNARWGGAMVARIAPDGRIDRIIQVPAPHVTCAAFGGPERTTLYITTARQGMDQAALAAHGQAGGLFQAETGIKGRAPLTFGVRETYP